MLGMLTIKLYKLSKPVAPDIDTAKIVKIFHSAKFAIRRAKKTPNIESWEMFR